MGQEASLPEGADEQFEQQARAPPSSTNPPLPGSQPPKNHPRPGKMIGAVFQKAASVRSHHQQQQQQQQQNGNHDPGMAHYGTGEQQAPHPTNGTSHPSSDGMISSGIPDIPTNLMGMINLEDQQQYYQQQQHLHQQHQQQQQHQHMYQMQQQHAQMMHHQYYHQQQQQQHHHPQQQQQQQQQQQFGAIQGTQPTHHQQSSDGNMYHTAVSNNNHAGNAKKGLNFRPSGRGAALINSMRNLSLGGAMTRAAGVAGISSPRGKEEVNEWETKWDEDDDDSDGEEEIAPPPPPVNHFAGNGPVALHPQLRPGMDIGLSSIQPSATTNRLDESHSYVATPPPTTLSSVDASHLPQKAHLVTATPDMGTDIDIHEELDIQHQQSQDVLEWDTGALQPQEVYEKPNVQMFLPLLRVLGKGSFGKVVLVQKRKGKERGALFAMKILKKTHLVKRRQIERTRTERKVLSVVNHPFIMKLHYAFQSPDKLYLVLDYCPGGELFFHLSRFRRFPERVARFYSAELLLSIGHLHKRGIIYRDLKPENVLLDADGHVKLGDFGLAKAGIKHPCEGATSMCGTPEYMAPEVLSQQGHGFCVDYWGLGMLVYEMMTGLPPWYTTDRAKLFRRLKSAPLDIPSYFSAASANCVSALLERNPRRRLGVTGIRTAMEHEFFRSISWRALYGRRVEAPIRPCEGWSPPEAVDSKETVAAATSNGSMRPGESASASSSAGIENMNSNELDAATANFDNTFTRMPVETEDKTHDDLSDDGETEELHDDTFVGFTFDDKDREEIAAVQAARQRSHPYQPNNTRQID